jgi:metal-sulfur cluster biosynthetic enzyme
METKNAKESNMNKNAVLAVLKQVYDPDYPDKTMIDLGIVTEDDITISNNRVAVVYGLTAPMCPFSSAIGLMIKYALETKLAVPVAVSLKASHHQNMAVNDFLSNPEKSTELMRMLKETGVLDKCVRL